MPTQINTFFKELSAFTLSKVVPMSGSCKGLIVKTES